MPLIRLRTRSNLALRLPVFRRLGSGAHLEISLEYSQNSISADAIFTFYLAGCDCIPYYFPPLQTAPCYTYPSITGNNVVPPSREAGAVVEKFIACKIQRGENSAVAVDDRIGMVFLSTCSAESTYLSPSQASQY